jgi:hypothetical protein
MLIIAGLFGLKSDATDWPFLITLLLSPIIFIWLLLTGLVYLPKILSSQNSLLAYLLIATISATSLTLHLSFIGFIIVLIPSTIVLVRYYYTKPNSPGVHTTVQLTTLKEQKPNRFVLKTVLAIIGLLFAHWILSLLFF